MCIVINLWGGPGCGKSTTMARIFSELKVKGYNVEMVSEFAKDLVYEKRDETMKDELYIFAKQNHRLFRVKDKVDIIVTDRPLPLTCVYDEVYGKNDRSLRELVRKTFREYDNINILLEFNTDNYKKEGRLQDQEEALNLHHKITDELSLYTIKYLDTSSHSIDKIMNYVEKKLKEKMATNVIDDIKPGDIVFVRNRVDEEWRKAILLKHVPNRGEFSYYTYKIGGDTCSYNKYITKEIQNEKSKN